MSTVRKHFWHDVSRWLGGFSSPRKYGLKGCIPAVVRSTEGSYDEGTSDADGMRRWPRSSKNDRYFSRISSALTRPESTKAADAGCGARICRLVRLLLEAHGAEVPSGVRLVQDRNHVGRADQVRLVPHPRDRRGGRDDLLVDVGPRLGARRVADDRLRLVHLGVERLVVEQLPVDVAGGDDVLPVEHRVDHRLRIREVLEPPDARADLRLVAWNGTELREHRVARGRPEVDLEAELLEAVQHDLCGRLLVAGVVGHHRDLRAVVLPVREAGLLQVAGRQLQVTARVLQVVHARPLGATGLVEARNARWDDVVGHLPDRGTAERQQHRLAVERRVHGLADVDIGEWLLAGVERDPARTARVR